MTTEKTNALRTALAKLKPATASNLAKIAVAETALECALELLDQVALSTGNEYARAHMLDHLRTLSRWRPCLQNPTKANAQIAQGAL